MSISTTATRAELVTLKKEVDLLGIMLRQVNDGSGAPATPGRYTAAQIDTQITAVSTAITAATA